MIYFFDMDDTLTDFSSRYEELVHTECPAHLSEKEKNVLFGYNFFRYMDPKHKMLAFVKGLIAKGEEVYILSAVGDVKQTVVSEAKNDWLIENVPELFNQKDPEDRVIFVPKSFHKAIYAKDEFVNYKGYAPSDLVLIDDRDKALIPWKEMGGEIIKVGK